MAIRTAKTPPTVHPAFDTPKPPPEPVARPATGIGVRGPEQRRVGYYEDAAGRRFVAAPHPDAGKPF